MPRYLLLTFILLTFVTASAFAADKSAGSESDVVHGGGMTCFSAKSAEDPLKEWWKGPSCDALCAGKGALCTGVEIINASGAHSPTTCAHAPLAGFTECRCCTVVR